MKRVIAVCIIVILIIVNLSFSGAAEAGEYAEDCTPKDGDRAFDINGLGYYAIDGINLINKDKFDYTCESFTGWTSGDGEIGDNFSIKDGYNDSKAIFAENLGTSTAVGSINPYIPLPEHTGKETFILTFALYGDFTGKVEWSSIFLYDENRERTTPVSGVKMGDNYCYGVTVSPEWSVNCVAFTPEKEDKYIRVAIGWASIIGIDNISIVGAEKLNVQINERYITNETAYDAEPIVLGERLNTAVKQYGEQYVSSDVPEMIAVLEDEYVLVTDKEEKWIDEKENGGVITIDYRYIKSEDAFLHPGLLNTALDLERIAEKVKNGEEPYLSGYNALLANSYAQIGNHRAVGTIIRGGTGDNCALLYRDVHRAYLCAIRWKISGDATYGDCARDILNGWSKTLKKVTGNADRYLASGIYGYEMACAAEIVRDYPGFEKEGMQDMLMNVFYKPLVERFLYSNEYGKDHNDAHIMNYWANWDLCNMAAAISIGVFCDRRDIYERAIDYYKFGPGNGSVLNFVPKLYEGSEDTLGVPVGQWQEAGRDMEHTQLGLGLAAVVCEIAWNQGDDIYSWANNRFLYGAEYVAQYHLGQNVPFTSYYWYSGNAGIWSSQSEISEKAGIRPVFEMIYNHYNKRMGVAAPGIEKLLETVRPEGGAGSHGSSFDQFGFGTLLYTRDNADFVNAQVDNSNVEEGIYIIKRSDIDSVLDVDDNGYVVQNARDENKTSQQWKIEDLGRGIYTLTNVKTGKTMSIENGSYDLGALVITDDYKEKFSQQFAFVNFEGRESGNYKIVPVGSGLCLDVKNGNHSDETNILQYTYNAHSFQKWSLEKVGGYIKVEKNEDKIDVELKGGSGDWYAICALYSSDGEVIEVIKEDEKDKFSAEFERKGKYVKVFWWDRSQKPMCGAITVE